ncbi:MULTISPECIES: hypothetical protein [unclassified Microcoleus]|uniref:hypothetical protein n=1 Tax=unclassified Microcoleus TaxID=2642155 RepID=UPI0025DEC6DE|nr:MULTISPECIES: hypothetical protein [unclassified Microcoleus]
METIPELGQLLDRRLFADTGLEVLLSGSRKGAIDLSIEAVIELWKLTTYLLVLPADNYAGGFELETQNCFLL